MKPFIIFLVYSFCCVVAKAQGYKKVDICVQDSLGAPVLRASCKVQDASRPLIILYKSLGDTGCTSLQISDQYTQVRLQLSHVGFKTLDTVLVLHQNVQAFTFVLQAKDATLPDAEVKAPPMWVRGDTTFFSVDAFKAPGENKLKDIITKMPGFEINESGRLLFKKKVVERITINDEEIFADKIELMLKSFPTHVLEQVQALEKQTRNKLLAGLHNEDLVFVNLKLKKDKVQAAFGDGEAAIGSGNRYKLNPVLFGLYKKWKLGLIADYNSLGTGFDWTIENELKMQSLAPAERWGLAGAGLHLVHNFPGTRYIQNRLRDNRLHITLPAAKKLTANVEINYVTDRQSQTTQFNSTLVSSASTFSRADSTLRYNNPRLLNTLTRLKWKLDSTQQLLVQCMLDANTGNNRLENNFVIAGSQPQLVTQQIANAHWSGGIVAEYTKRVSAQKAHVLSASWYRQQIVQHGAGLSRAYAAIFQVGSQLEHLQQQLGVRRQAATFKYDRFTAGAQKSFKYYITAGWQQVNTGNTLGLGTTAQKTDTVIAPLSNKGLFTEWHTNLHAVKTMQLGTWRGHLRSSLGTALVSAGREGAIGQYAYPLAELGYRVEKRKNRRNFYVEVVQAHKSPELMHTIDFLYPQGLDEYGTMRGVHLSRSSTSLNASYSLSKNRSTHSFLVMANRYWNSSAMFNEIDQFFNFFVDSFSKTPTHHAMVNYNLNILPGPQGYQIHGYASYNYFQRLYVVGNKLEAGFSEMLSSSITLHKNWHKKYYLTAKTGLNMVKNTLPTQLGNFGTGWVGSWISRLENRNLISQRLTILSSVEWFRQNLFTPNRNQFFMVDAEVSYSFPQKPYSVRLRLENLANERFFMNVDNNAQAQSFFQMPLVPRNIILFVRVEF